MHQLIKLAFIGAMLSSFPVLADRAPGELYPRTCAVCHDAGVANAPKVHDVAAWTARREAKDDAAMVESVKNGLNAMPPRGMCMDCTDAEYLALINFMASEK